MISLTLREHLERLPVSLLVAVPALLAAVTASLWPTWSLTAAWLGVLGAVVVGAAVAQGTRDVGRRTPKLGRELLALHTRVIRDIGHADVLKQVVGASRESVSSASETTSQLLAELVRAEEATRAQLAAELHDTVAQSLAHALMQLDRIGEPDVPNGLESVREAEEQLRAVLARIRPPELAEGDLASAIADLCAEMRSRYGVDVHVSWPEVSVPLSGALATTTYRFAQETLLNAVEHADGVGVRLDVSVNDDWELVVTVSDRGPGFRVEDVDSSMGRHVGLRLARERARLAGGRLDVVSRVGFGTTVRLQLPLTIGARRVRLRSV